MKNTFKQISITLIIAIIGGVLFSFLHIPVPWLLGPMIVVLISANITKRKFVWPRSIRNSGMIIVGYTIGLSMTTTALHEMVLQLPYMFLMTVLLLFFCAGIAYLVSKLSDSDYRTLLLASIPGGLSQIIMLAEETKGINLAIVTITQVIRVMIIIIVMPLLVLVPMFADSGSVGTSTTTNVVRDLSIASWNQLFPNILIFTVICILFALLGSKIKFPTAYLIGPAIGTAILQAYGIEGPQLPSPIINAAQLMLGTYVGLMLTPNQIPRKIKTFGLALGSGFMLVFGAIGLSILLTKLQPISNATALLSLAPGGMDQMGVIAHAINADLSFVSGYQLFRTFFIFFAVPPLIRLIFNIADKRKIKHQSQS
ncbi:AbrB family transcriptional regulator [Lederbergia wuyishanensis]|uniref:Membrane AbrB-like protein n=1 Tax=Lederbergia wuyishanensis TaxID=1347903 RepID=A0ABU0D6D8_9BACI|nr:AbrB family transcriptional regulator [Lederbergia wuyishanensis]MCJ8008629.1 AbrB family transcriptional regulator [Lederbergia wuyishanensis]MDQ0343955.1 membrane AbrB-like protein [Lederbergia wuyishanensis]